MNRDIEDGLAMNVLRTAPVRAPARSGTAPHILVVEDEQALGLLLSYNLEAEGFTVERVERGDEAELRLSELPPDLLILDWMLPGVSGLEICRRLSGARDHPDLARHHADGAGRGSRAPCAGSRSGPTTTW